MHSKAKMIQEIEIPTPFLVGPVNVYLIKGDCLTLVDTGPKTELAKSTLINAVKNLGYDITDIEQVILTHHHPDHVGLVEELFPQAKILGHEKCNPWIRKEPSFLAYLEQFFTVFFKRHAVPAYLIERMILANRDFLTYTGSRGLDVKVKEGDFIEGLPDWQVIETPGHAQSHISLYHEGDGVLIGGDHIISTISSNAILEPPEEKGKQRPKTLLQYRDSLQRCMDLSLRKVYSGHGVAIEDVTELLIKRINDQDRKAAKLKSLISSDGSSSFQLCEIYFQQVYKKQPMLTMSEVIGHLDLLVEKDEVTLKDENGLTFYQIK